MKGAGQKKKLQLMEWKKRNELVSRQAREKLQKPTENGIQRADFFTAPTLSSTDGTALSGFMD